MSATPKIEQKFNHLLFIEEFIEYLKTREGKVAHLTVKPELIAAMDAAAYQLRVELKRNFAYAKAAYEGRLPESKIKNKGEIARRDRRREERESIYLLLEDYFGCRTSEEEK